MFDIQYYNNKVEVLSIDIQYFTPQLHHFTTFSQIDESSMVLQHCFKGCQ